MSDIRKVALALPGARESPYAGVNFKVGKKSFVTWWAKTDQWIFKLPHAHQDILFEVRPEIFQPYRCGAMLWSFVDVPALAPKDARALVVEAWTTIVPKRVSKAYFEGAAA